MFRVQDSRLRALAKQRECRGYIWILEKNIRNIVLYRGYIGGYLVIEENQTSIQGFGLRFLRFKVSGFWVLRVQGFRFLCFEALMD